jgi:hypothetical protein
MLVSGWSAQLCGPFKCWRVDSQGSGYAAFSQLPVSFSGPPASAFANAVRGNAINTDGSVICGYDQNYNSAQTQILRRPAVWVRNAANTSWTQTVLDADGGEAYALSGNGLVVVGHDHNNLAARWTRPSTTSTVWTAAPSMGAGQAYPTGVSNDGLTVVGEQFIWNANINGGVAVDLSTYLLGLGLDLTASNGMRIQSPAGVAVQGITGDGSAIGVALTNHTDPCLVNFTGGMIYLNGHDCVAPTSIMQPASDTHVEIGRTGYYFYGCILNAPVAGTWPISYQWQKWDAANGVWADLVNDVPCDVGYGQAQFDVKNATGTQLRIGFQKEVLFGDLSWRGRFRCVATNSCGSVTSNWAILNTCSADFNCDGATDFFDYLDFVDGFSSGNDFADFNRDGTIDFFDYLDFVDAFSAGC